VSVDLHLTVGTLRSYNKIIYLLAIRLLRVHDALMASPLITPPTPRPADLHSNEAFQSLIENLADYAIFVIDPAGQIASWNRAGEQLTGYTGQEVIGKHFSLFYTPADLAADKPATEMRRAEREGQVESEEWWLRKDGSRFWASVTITRILGEKNLLGFGTIVRDVTDRRLSDLRYRLLVEGVQDYAIFSLDPNGVVTSWNVGAERIKGYKPEEIIGKNFSTFYTPEDRANELPKKVLGTAASEGHFVGEGWRVRKDGTRFWSSVVVTALRDDEGHLYGFSKVTRDMTERKQLLDAIQQHARELELRIQEREESNAELEAFAYSVSHDLRAPIRAISGFAEALREDCAANLDDRGLDYLNEITNAAHRMNTLVQDLLEYGRVSRINMPLQTVSLLDAVQQASQQLGDQRRGSLEIDVAADLYVEGHPPVLTQVVLNLLTNAFKFHSKDTTPEVNVFAEQRNGRIRLNVRDNGIGIAPQHHERIWQVFERLHEREAYPGTGIGLAIVKRAVGRMHGSYGVESDVGKGSTFWIELPEASASKMGESKEAK
jgi:PAS domain S-box-containing protein